jgi:GNAT superfamily N-acetyltransferase
MSATSPIHSELAARARAWHHRNQAAVCDVVTPWAHGTVVRSTRCPSYSDFNLVRVEDDPALNVPALSYFTDQALAGLSHRRIDFDLSAAAGPLQGRFAATGWKTKRLVWMRYHQATPPGPPHRVEDVSYDSVNELRIAWHREELPGGDAVAFLDEAREIALLRDARVLSLQHGERQVGFAQLERDGHGAEITLIYVHPEYRGAGRGTALTHAAIERAGDVHDLWISADDESRPKAACARLGFRPAWTTMEFLRVS